MPKAGNGMKFILVIIDDNLNYMVTVPLPQIKMELVCEALNGTSYFKAQCTRHDKL